MNHADALLPLKQVMRLTGLKSRTSIYNLIQRDGTFPRPVKLGTRGTRFRQSELQQWMDRLPRKHGPDQLL